MKIIDAVLPHFVEKTYVAWNLSWEVFNLRRRIRETQRDDEALDAYPTLNYEEEKALDEYPALDYEEDIPLKNNCVAYQAAMAAAELFIQKGFIMVVVPSESLLKLANGRQLLPVMKELGYDALSTMIDAGLVRNAKGQKIEGMEEEQSSADGFEGGNSSHIGDDWYKNKSNEEDQRIISPGLQLLEWDGDEPDDMEYGHGHTSNEDQRIINLGLQLLEWAGEEPEEMEDGNGHGHHGHGLGVEGNDDADDTEDDLDDDDDERDDRSTVIEVNPGACEHDLCNGMDAEGQMIEVRYDDLNGFLLARIPRIRCCFRDLCRTLFTAVAEAGAPWSPSGTRFEFRGHEGQLLSPVTANFNSELMEAFLGAVCTIVLIPPNLL